MGYGTRSRGECWKLRNVTLLARVQNKDLKAEIFDRESFIVNRQ